MARLQHVRGSKYKIFAFKFVRFNLHNGTTILVLPCLIYVCVFVYMDGNLQCCLWYSLCFSALQRGEKFKAENRIEEVKYLNLNNKFTVLYGPQNGVFKSLN